MSITYDPETDTLTIILSDAQVEESDEIKQGTMLDFDAQGKIVAMEILLASEGVQAPSQIEYRVVPLAV